MNRIFLKSVKNAQSEHCVVDHGVNLTEKFYASPNGSGIVLSKSASIF